MLNPYAMRATKSQLRKEIHDLRLVGQQMSNLCFNLSRDDSIAEHYRDLMDECYKEWDSIERSETVLRDG